MRLQVTHYATLYAQSLATTIPGEILALRGKDITIALIAAKSKGSELGFFFGKPQETASQESFI